MTFKGISNRLSKFKLHFGLIGIAFVAILLMGSLIPGDVLLPSVSASFGTPVYSTTHIDIVAMYDNSTALITWSRTTNPDETPNMALNQWIESIRIDWTVYTSLLAPGGSIMNHVKLDGTLTSPTGTVTSLTDAQGKANFVSLGADHGYAFYRYQWLDLNYQLSEVGTYRLYFVMSIEIP
jgi:hypothetical protein